MSASRWRRPPLTTPTTKASKSSSSKCTSPCQLTLFDSIYRAQDNYEIIKKIGRGKYSEVYEGINTLTNQRIVIKILKPGKSASTFLPA